MTYRTRYTMTFSSTFPWIVARVVIIAAGALAFWQVVERVS